MSDFVAKPVDPAALNATLPHRLLARLREIPGLDPRRGIAAVRGKTTKYLDLLRQLVSTHADDMTRLSELLAADDREAALRLAHSLKGVAATLGFEALSASAARIERALLETPRTAIDAVRTEMEEIHRHFMALAAVLPAPTFAAASPAPVPPPDLAAWRELLERCDGLLAISDITAIALFKENTDSFRAVLGDSFEQFARQLLNYDFNSARQTLRARR